MRGKGKEILLIGSIRNIYRKVRIIKKAWNNQFEEKLYLFKFI